LPRHEAQDGKDDQPREDAEENFDLLCICEKNSFAVKNFFSENCEFE
jgi:hypothetical protein